MPTTPRSLIAPIARHAVWPAGATGATAVTGAADVAFVEPLLRRRLSPQARMVLNVANDCAAGVADARIVFASRHGELQRTTTLLEALAAGEGLSPTLFSMSVLNASSGLFSILQKNTAPATAISAGRASFGYGLLEACLQLAEQPQQPVLFVYADEPAPALYAAGEAAGHHAHAIALLLDSAAATRIRCTQTVSAEEKNAEETSGEKASAEKASGDAASKEAQSLAFLRCFDDGAGGSARWNDGDRVWCWERAQ